MDEDVNEKILRDVLGTDIDHELLDFAAGAGGNRQLVVELALGLTEEGLLKDIDGTVQLTRWQLPHRVLAFVKQQLVKLSANCQQFLKVAAILGRSFMLEDASRILDRTSAHLLEPLDEAMDSGFVVATEQQLTFQSDFLWRGVIESIPSPARAALQREAVGHAARRTLEYDQKFWVLERPSETSHVVEREDAGAYSKAHSLIMNGSAATGIRVAKRVLASPGTSSPARLDAEASVILGYFLLDEGEAERHSEGILRERRTGQGDVATLMALTTLSNVRWRAGELTEGLSLGRTAVRYSHNVDPVWRLHFQLALAGKLANLREFDRAESLITDVESVLHELPTPVWTAAPAAMRSRLYLQAGKFSYARQQAELATAAVDHDAVPMLRPLALSVLSTVALYMGSLPAAVEHLQQARREMAGERMMLYSAQYAWTDVRIAVKSEGPHAAVELLSDKYSHLPAQRSLYIEDPSAAAFLIRLALDAGDTNLKESVLGTVNGLAEDNPGISVVNLSAVQANAVAHSDPEALERVITQSPDPISIALATEELARLHSARTALSRRQTTLDRVDPPPVNSEAVASQADATCWASLSDMERRIAYLVSVGMTNRQIAKRVHLSAHTVNYHLRKVYRKLGINTRVELARGAAIYSVGKRGEGELRQSGS